MEAELTQEENANFVAERYHEAEHAIRNLIRAVNMYVDKYPIGPIHKAAIVGQISGALGMVAQSHLLASKFDPRPQTEDDGGGK